MRRRRALVISVTNSIATLLTDDGQFLVRRLSHEAVGGDRVFLSHSIPLTHRLRKLGVIAATVIVTLFAVFSPGLIMPGPDVFAYVSFDINPSLELEIDSSARVLTCRPTNESGRLLLARGSCRNAPLERAVETLFSRAVNAGLAGQHWPVLITVVPHDIVRAGPCMSELAELAAQGVLRAGGTVTTLVSWNPAVTSNARELELSGGRYLAVLACEAVGVDIPAVEAAGVSMSELISRAGGVEALRAVSLTAGGEGGTAPDPPPVRPSRILWLQPRDVSPVNRLWRPSLSR